MNNPGDGSAMPPEMLRKLEAVLRHDRQVRLQTGLLRACAILIAAMLVMMTLDWLIAPPAGLWRWVMTLSALACGIAALVLGCLIPILRPRSLESAAMEVDRTNPALEERCQTLTGFAQSKDKSELRGSEAMLRKVAQQTAALSSGVVPADVISKSGLLRAVKYFAVAAAALALFFVVDFQRAKILSERFFAPSADLSLTQVQSKDGDLLIGKGENVSLEFTVTGKPVDSASISIKSATGKNEIVSLAKAQTNAPGAAPKYVYAANGVTDSFDYRARAGDGQTVWHHVTVLDRPGLAGVQLRIVAPAYSHLPVIDEKMLPRRVRALEGSQMEVSFQADQDLDSMDLKFADGKTQRLTLSPDHRYHFSTTLTNTLAFEPVLVNTYHLDNKTRPNCQIIVYPDLPPTVKITSPASQISARPDDVLKIQFEARDDFGVSKADLVVNVQNDNGSNTTQVIHIPFNTNEVGARLVRKEIDLDLAQYNLKQDQELTYSIRVTDTKNGAGLSTPAPPGTNAMAQSNPNGEASSQGQASKTNANQNSASRNAGVNPREAQAGRPELAQNSSAQTNGQNQAGSQNTAQRSSQNQDGRQNTDQNSQGQNTQQNQNQLAQNQANNQPGAQNPPNQNTPQNPPGQNPGQNQLANQNAAQNSPQDQANRQNGAQNSPGQNASQNQSAQNQASQNQPAQESAQNQTTPQTPGQNSPSQNPSQNNSQTPAGQPNRAQISSQPQQSSSPQSNQNPESAQGTNTSPQQSHIPMESGTNSQANSQSPAGSQPPQNSMTQRALDVPGQTTAGQQMRVKVDEWANAFDSQMREKQELAIEPTLKLLDAALAKAHDLTESALLAAQSKTGLSDAQSPVLEDDKEQIREADKAAGELKKVSTGTAYAFIGLQISDISQTHISPARQELGEVALQPAQAKDDLDNLQQASFHIIQARKMLADLTKTYETAKRDNQVADAMQHLQKMHQIFLQDTQAMLGSSKPPLNSMNRKVAEVSDDYVAQLNKLMEEQKKIMAELAKILANDPRMLRRFMALNELEGTTLRDQLTLLDQRQQALTKQTAEWVVADDKDRTDLASQAQAAQISGQNDVSDLAGKMHENMITWLPDGVADDQEPVATALKIAAEGSRLATESAGSSGSTNLTASLGYARQALDQFRLLHEYLPSVSETDVDGKNLSVYTANRLNESADLITKESGWVKKMEALTNGNFPGAAEVDQNQLALDTTTLSEKLESAAASINNLSTEIHSKSDQLVHTVEKQIIPEESRAADSLGRATLKEAVTRQDGARAAFTQAGTQFDELLKLLAAKQDATPPPNQPPPNQTLDQMLAMLNEEKKAAESLGLPNRPINVQVMQDWLKPGSQQQSGSAQARNPGQRPGQRPGQFPPQTDQQRQANAQARAREQQAREAADRAARLTAQARADAKAVETEAAQHGIVDNSGSGTAKPPANAWNTIASELGDELRQGRDNIPPEQYREAIEQYFNTISETVPATPAPAK